MVTHKTALIHNWLLTRERIHLYFTPTSSSWQILIERWFSLLPKTTYGVESIGAPKNWKPQSKSIWESATKILNISPGPNLPTRFWNRPKANV